MLFPKMGAINDDRWRFTREDIEAACGKDKLTGDEKNSLVKLAKKDDEAIAN